MKNKNPEIEGFTRLENSNGILITGIWVKNDSSEIIIKSSWGTWHFKHPDTNEDFYSNLISQLTN